MNSQGVWWWLEMPWYIAIALAVLGCAISVIVVVRIVENAKTRRLSLLCSMVDKLGDRADDLPTLRSALQLIADHSANDAQQMGWSPAAVCEALGKVPQGAFVSIVVMFWTVVAMVFIARHEIKHISRSPSNGMHISRNATFGTVESRPGALVEISTASTMLDSGGVSSMMPPLPQESSMGRFLESAFYSRLSCNGDDFLNPPKMAPESGLFTAVVH